MVGLGKDSHVYGGGFLTIVGSFACMNNMFSNVENVNMACQLHVENTCNYFQDSYMRVIGAHKMSNNPPHAHCACWLCRTCFSINAVLFKIITCMKTCLSSNYLGDSSYGFGAL